VQLAAVPLSPVAGPAVRAAHPPPNAPLPALQRWQFQRCFLFAERSLAHRWAVPDRSWAREASAAAVKRLLMPATMSTAAKSHRCLGVGVGGWRLGCGGGRATATEAEAVGRCLRPVVSACPSPVRLLQPAACRPSGGSSMLVRELRNNQAFQDL
jgi:hypothetical protein